VACDNIASGENIVKYGCTIGVAVQTIKKGEWVHDHNIRSARSAGKPAVLEWYGRYHYDMRASSRVFAGFRRRGSRPGIRNDLWVIPAAKRTERKLRHFVANYRKPYWIDAVRLLDHPSFCPNADSEEDIDILLGLACAPNTAGVLLTGHGRENMPLTDIRDRALSAGGRVACTVLREDSGYDIVAGCLDNLAAASPRLREEFPASELCVGIRGVSGGYSGLSANPLLGRFAERMASLGAAVLAPAGIYMTDIREAISERIIAKTAYDKFMAIASTCSPAEPDEWENGVTTKEERALASCPITGKSPVTAFLGYGETAIRAGGVQIVSSSGEPASDCVILAAAGAQLILLATVRETPFGGVVPTAKISSADANAHPKYSDFSAETILAGESLHDAAKRLEDYAISVACGEKVFHESRAIRGNAG
jgi:altronate hydrolase